jgi:hypothetical protein
MQNMPDMSEILRIAQTREGRSLLAMLQSADPAVLNSAAEQVKKGNYDGAKAALADMLNTPEGRALMSALGGNHGGTGR